MSPFTEAKADSDATNYYWRDKDMNCLTNLQKKLRPPVILPDGSPCKEPHHYPPNFHPTQSVIQSYKTEIIHQLSPC